MRLGKAAEAIDEPLAAKSGDVLTVRTPELGATTRSVPSAIRSKASRRTVRYYAPGLGDDQRDARD